MNPLIPSPGSPKIVSTPHSTRRASSASETVSAISLLSLRPATGARLPERVLDGGGQSRARPVGGGRQLHQSRYHPEREDYTPPRVLEQHHRARVPGEAGAEDEQPRADLRPRRAPGPEAAADERAAGADRRQHEEERDVLANRRDRAPRGEERERDEPDREPGLRDRERRDRHDLVGGEQLQEPPRHPVRAPHREQRGADVVAGPEGPEASGELRQSAEHRGDLEHRRRRA